MQYKNTSIRWLFALLSMLTVTGCTLTLCDEGNVVCMDDQDERMIIYQSDMCEGSRCAISQPQSCQLYRCQGETYIPIPNGSCPLGSQMLNGILSCIPLCSDGEIVCAIQDENDKLDIKQFSSEDEGAVNNTPCQKYKCLQNEYVPIDNGYCTLGSHIADGALSCLPRCEGKPATRCKTDQNQTMVQTCSNDGDEQWQTTFCANSCQYDKSSDYEEDGYKAGICGECRNDMQPYCSNADDGNIVVIGCENGIQTSEIVSACPDGMQTKCETGFVFLNSDKNHCGSCEVACTGNENCIRGKCDPCDEDGYTNYLLDNQSVRAYCIHNESEFKEFHDHLKAGKNYPEDNTNHIYIIVDDINYTDNWEPLGTKEQPVENITLIGQSHKVSFEQPIEGDQFAGVFGVVKNSLFDSINIPRASVKHKELVKDIKEPQSEEAPAIGGFIGMMDNTKIQNSQFNVEVNGSVNLGGIAGIVRNSEIINSWTSGKVTADPYSSPDVACGYNTEEVHNGTTYKYYEKFEALAVNLGGIAGYMESSSFNQVHSNAALVSVNNLAIKNVGGLIGYARYSNQVSDSYRNADILVAGENVGGLIGYIYSQSPIKGTVIERSRFSGPSEDVQGTIDTMARLESLKDIAKCDEIDCKQDDCDKVIAEYYGSNSSSSGGLIGTVEGTGRLQLTENIINGAIYGYSTSGGYVGSFFNYDESFHDTKITINIDNCILFDNVENKCIETAVNNISLINMSGWAGGVIGSVFGDVSLNIDNLSLRETISSKNDVGGIIGYINGSDFTIHPTITIKNTDIDATIKDCTFEVGGLIGANQYEVELYLYLSNDTIKFNIDGDAYYVGGIAGALTSSTAYFDNTDVSGNINCKSGCGGIVGQANELEIGFENLTIHDLSIKGQDDIGGLAGYYSGSISYDSGQLIANHLNIQGEDNVGGMLGIFRGSELQLDKSFVNAVISGNENVGGIIGQYYRGYGNYQDVSFDYMMINVVVSGHNALGGIIGRSHDVDFHLNNTGLLVSILRKDSATSGGLIGIEETNSNASLSFSSYQYLTFLNNDDVGYSAYLVGEWLKSSPSNEFNISPSDYYYNVINKSMRYIGNNGTLALDSSEMKEMQFKDNRLVDNVNKPIVDSLEMKECTFKLYTSADGTSKCLTVPYPVRIILDTVDYPIYSKLCIPEDQMSKECNLSKP